MSDFVEKWKRSIPKDKGEHAKFGSVIGVLAGILSAWQFSIDKPQHAFTTLLIALLVHPVIEFIQSFDDSRTVDALDAFAGMAMTALLWCITIEIALILGLL